MQVNRHIHGILDGGNQIISLLGTHDAGHVLNADGGSAHFLQLLDHFHILGVGVDGGGGVGDGAGGDGAGLHGSFHSHLQVVDVVQSVEDTDHIDTVLHGLLNEQLHEIIGVVGVAQHVLSTQQHLQLGVGHLGTDLAQTLPGIFIQVAQADIEGSTAPALGCVVAGLVDSFQHGLELLVRQTGGDQGLVGITQHSFHKLNFSCHVMYDLHRKYWLQTENAVRYGIRSKKYGFGESRGFPPVFLINSNFHRVHINTKFYISKQLFHIFSGRKNAFLPSVPE